MLNPKDIKEMEDYVKEEDGLRETLIANSRCILKDSKSAILLHPSQGFEGSKEVHRFCIINNKQMQNNTAETSSPENVV